MTIMTLQKASEIYGFKIDGSQEYYMLPFTNWYTMDFGFMFDFGNYKDDTQPLNETYVVITKNIEDIRKPLLDTFEKMGYTYKNGEIFLNNLKVE